VSKNSKQSPQCSLTRIRSRNIYFRIRGRRQSNRECAWEFSHQSANDTSCQVEPRKLTCRGGNGGNSSGDSHNDWGIDPRRGFCDGRGVGSMRESCRAEGLGRRELGQLRGTSLPARSACECRRSERQHRKGELRKLHLGLAWQRAVGIGVHSTAERELRF
jgi:hypothetical protein